MLHQVSMSPLTNKGSFVLLKVSVSSSTVPKAALFQPFKIVPSITTDLICLIHQTTATNQHILYYTGNDNETTPRY